MATRWLTVSDVALLCDVDRATVRQWVRRGHIKKHPTTGRIDAASVVRYLDVRGTRGQHTDRPKLDDAE